MKALITLFVLSLLTSGLIAGSADFDSHILPLLKSDRQLLAWLQKNLEILPHTAQGLRVRQDMIEGIPQKVLKEFRLTRWAPFDMQARLRSRKNEEPLGLNIVGPNEFWLLRKLAGKKLTDIQLAQSKLPVSLSLSKANERRAYSFDVVNRPPTETANYELEIKPWLNRAPHLLKFLEQHFKVIKSLGADCHRHIAPFVTAAELVTLPALCAPFLLSVTPRKGPTKETFQILLTGPTVIEPIVEKSGAPVFLDGSHRGFVLTLFSEQNGTKTLKLLQTIKKAE